MSNRHRGKGGKVDDHLDLLTPTLARLRRLSVPWIVENVPPAKRVMHVTLTLHGGMFPGLGVHRPRIFESNVLILAPQARPVQNPLGVYGKHHDGRRLFDRADGTIQRAPKSLAEAREAMGMPWASWHGCKEAIPPAYTEFIGAQLLDYVTAGRAA
jgi:DNA (cytosine-5)-methyltransferase 1